MEGTLAERGPSVGVAGNAPRSEEEILLARAKVLAEDRSGQEDHSRRLDVLLFEVGANRYALELRHLREALAPGEITPVPFTPDFVLGVVNVRSRILSVLDTEKLLGVARDKKRAPSRLIVLEAADMEFGLAVDGVEGVDSLPESQIHPPPDTLARGNAKYIRGVTPGRVVVLDGKQILSDKSLRMEPAGQEDADQ
ncbi:MAG: purine-binding chemotaxis protein CheW [Deltaproteobacteria bacterium]|nr:purine-binding chemotaxis protein CheW [Deltaproteobacteria bacterium]